MRVPTDLEILSTVYRIYHSDFVSFERGEGARTSKIYVPIDCKKVAQELKVDSDIVFGRLYYHFEKQYGYKQDDGSNVHFFALKVGNDPKCVNFPLMTSVLADLHYENRKFRIGTAIAVLALVVSISSFAISVTQWVSSIRTSHSTDEVVTD